MSARTSILALAVLVPASSLAAEDSYRHGYMRTVEQGVTLQRASEAAAEIAAPNLPFLPGDRVWSDEAGRMEVQFADGSVLRLDSRSKLDYVAHDSGRAERVVLRLWSGALFLHYRGGRRSPDFTIETPEGVLEPGERGVYRLDVAPGEARVAVLDGEATVEAGRRVRVSRGEEVVVREGELYAGPDSIGYGADDSFARWDAEQEEQLRYADERHEEWLPEEVSPYAADFAAYGSWRSDPTYGNVWYPRVDVGWRPYTSGHWAWTVYGWTWVPYERWGWAAFHYGRWGYSDFGWYWIPGKAWGPAWVSWSVGRSHVGWCALGYGDKPVFVNRRSRFRGHAVPRGNLIASTASTPWFYLKRDDMGKRDLARRRVEPGHVPTGELQVPPAGAMRLSRDLRLVEGKGAFGKPVAGGALPRNVATKPTIGDTVPELRTDPTTTIRRPIPRRPRDKEPSEPPAVGGEPTSSGTGVPRAPGKPPMALSPNAEAGPREPRGDTGSRVPRDRVRFRRDQPEDGGAGTSQWGERDRERRDDAGGSRPEGVEDGARPRGDRDRETLRPIFGPLSRPRTEDNAGERPGTSRRDDGGSQRDGAGQWGRPRPDRGGSEGGASRPSGMSNAPRDKPAERPQSERPQARERGKSKDKN